MLRTRVTVLILTAGASLAVAAPSWADGKETVVVPSYPVVVGPVEAGTPSVYSKDEKDSFEESLAKCMEDGYTDYATDGDCDPKT